MDLLIIRNLRHRHNAARSRMRSARLYLREMYDPFEQATEEEFVKLFRLNKEICKVFIEIIEPYMDEHPYGISKTTRILCALRFFATGKYKQLHVNRYVSVQLKSHILPTTHYNTIIPHNTC